MFRPCRSGRAGARILHLVMFMAPAGTPREIVNRPLGRDGEGDQRVRIKDRFEQSASAGRAQPPSRRAVPRRRDRQVAKVIDTRRGQGR